jgi:hypothetical protein
MLFDKGVYESNCDGKISEMGFTFGKMSTNDLVRQMLDAGRLLTAGELGLDRKLGRGTSKQETLTTFLANAHNFLAWGTYERKLVRRNLNCSSS